MKIINDTEFQAYYRLVKARMESEGGPANIFKLKRSGKMSLTEMHSLSFIDHMVDPEGKGFFFGQRTTAEASWELLKVAQESQPRFFVAPRVWVKQEADEITWSVWTYVCEPTTELPEAERIWWKQKTQL